MKGKLLLIFFVCFGFRALTQQNTPFNIIPAPREISLGKGIFELTEKTGIFASDACMEDAKYFAEWLSKATNKKFEVRPVSEISESGFILINAAKKFEDTSQKLPALPGISSVKGLTEMNDSYRMIAENRAIIINAVNDVGAFYALQTLRQIIAPAAESGKLKLPYQIPGFTVKDESHFHHRGILLDCSRHFMSKEFILRYLDLLALYKLNVFHWHLTDDQGWRLQIDAYPELTSKGGVRTDETGKVYGGFYTKNDVREVVAYAKNRHITIIPEIEMPGHTIAAISAYPGLSCSGKKIPVTSQWGVFSDVICPGKEESFVFIEKVLSEVCELFPGPYIHIGGDETPTVNWESCDKCRKRMHDEGIHSVKEYQAYFTKRIAEFLSEKNKRIIGWDEILHDNLDASIIIQSWRGEETAIRSAKLQHPVIMSPSSHCYLDYDLTATDVFEIIGFNPIPDSLNSVEQKFIIGAECAMWTEHSPQQLTDSKVFPRLLAFSEVIWQYPDSVSKSEFVNRLLHHLPRLEALNVDYGFPAVPCAVVSGISDDRKITVDVVPAFEGVKFSYAIRPFGSDVTPPMSEWKNKITIDTPTEVLISASMKNREYPEIISKKFDPHLALGARTTILFELNKTYSGGGTSALTDGKIGSTDFRDGLWQATQGGDMEVIIELEKETTVSYISTNWYHYVNAWIFRPEKVTFYGSNDGVHYSVIHTTVSEKEMNRSAQMIISHANHFNPVKCKFIKMKAENIGKCPEWHNAPGEPAWLFCDEIVVK